MFGLATFDRIFQSYTLSMIPGLAGRDPRGRGASWRPAVGSISSISGNSPVFPGCGARLLFAWLAKFDVTPRATLKRTAEEIGAAQGLEVDFLPLRLGYAWTARLSRA